MTAYNTNSNSQPAAPFFNLQRVYLKDLSIEMPHAPQIFLEEEAAQVEVNVKAGGMRLTESVFESTVTATITTKIKDKVLYLVEGTQAGIFEFFHIPSDQVDTLLGVIFPTIIYPYLRGHIADAITRTSLPALHLAEVNFQLMYEQQLAATVNQQEGSDVKPDSIHLPPNMTKQ